MDDARRRSAASLFARVYDLDASLERPTVQSEPPVVRLCALILQELILSGGDEARLLPDPTGTVVEYRFDDVWRTVMKVPARIHGLVVNRLKVMANLDIAKRPEQSGMLLLRSGGRDVSGDITVTVATDRSEHVVVRLRESGAERGTD